MILYAFLSYGPSGLLWLFQIICGLSLVIGILYFLLIVKITKGDDLIKFFYPVFQISKIGYSAVPVSAEQKYYSLRQWILIEAQPHTGLPNWFLKESRSLQKELAQVAHSVFWSKIRQDIQNALLARGCHQKAIDFSKEFPEN